MQLTVHLHFSHTPRDQLSVLGAKIEDEDFLVLHFRTQ
jgi:hypothetical protein